MKGYILFFLLLFTYDLLLEVVSGIEHSDLTTSHFPNLLITLLNVWFLFFFQFQTQTIIRKGQLVLCPSSAKFRECKHENNKVLVPT